jgi:hypothetical protein
MLDLSLKFNSELRSGLLVKAFYRSQHLNVSTSGRHKVHNDSGPRISGGHCGGNTGPIEINIFVPCRIRKNLTDENTPLQLSEDLTAEMRLF